MDKKILIYITIAVLVSGLAGFYIGRYYEKTATMKKFQKMRGGMQFQGREGTGNRMRGPQVQSQPIPTDQTTPSR